MHEIGKSKIFPVHEIGKSKIFPVHEIGKSKIFPVHEIGIGQWGNISIKSEHWSGEISKKACNRKLVVYEKAVVSKTLYWDSSSLSVSTFIYIYWKKNFEIKRGQIYIFRRNFLLTQS